MRATLDRERDRHYDIGEAAGSALQVQITLVAPGGAAPAGPAANGAQPRGHRLRGAEQRLLSPHQRPQPRPAGRGLVPRYRPAPLVQHSATISKASDNLP